MKNYICPCESELMCLNSLPLNSESLSKKDALCYNSEITPCITPSDVECDVLKEEGGMPKIHM